MKTVGIWLPSAEQGRGGYGPAASDHYRLFQEVLRENYNLERVDLASGRIAGEIDTLLLVAPQNLSDLERLAVDQYLMRGGAVLVLSGGYQLDLPPGASTLNVRKIEGGLSELLVHYGITVEPALVMDLQNEPFPIPVNRDLGGFTVQEIRQLDYPYFVDVRSDGMAKDSPVTASLPAVTMNWVSPLLLNEERSGERQVTILLRSSADSWVSESTEIQPDFQLYPRFGFGVGEEMAPQDLAVSTQGEFSSYFAGRPDPRLVEAGSGADKAAKEGKLPPEPLMSKSLESARLVVVGSSEFINDTVLGISQSIGQDRFLNSLEFLQNLVDWSVADEDLLAIRSRGSHARLLTPLTPAAQAIWEWLNYGVALLALLAVTLYGALKVRREVPMPLV
jgi:ABC-2 type transport system permease protein